MTSTSKEYTSDQLHQMKAAWMWQLWFMLSQLLSQLLNRIYHDTSLLVQFKEEKRIVRVSPTLAALS